MMKKKFSRVIFLTLLFLTFVPAYSFAAIGLSSSGWEAGGFWINYGGIPDDHTVRVYLSTDNTNFYLARTFSAEDYPSQYEMTGLDNGVTYYFYIQDVQTGEKSPVWKQTPFFTVYVVNWPDSFFNEFVPSQSAMNNLNDALDGARDKLGFNDAINSANNLKQALDNTSLSTSGDLSFTVPITQGVNVTLFTDEQLSKFAFIHIMRDCITAFIWIMFVIWLITRFTPGFKV